MKFKTIIVVLLFISINVLNVNADEKRIIISGMTKHFKDTDRTGKKYNANNYGIGFEYNKYDKKHPFYTTYGIEIISDSYKNPFPFIAIGKEYRQNNILNTNIGIAYGINLFGGVKKIINFKIDNKTGKSIENKDNSKYYPLISIAPSLKIFYKKAALNIYISPKISYSNGTKTYYAEGFVYTTFSYKF